MIQITEKIRGGIALNIKSITVQEAEKIASEAGTGLDTIYRYIREIKNGKLSFKNELVINALASMALKQKTVASKNHKRMRVLEKQFSQKSAA